MKTSVFVLLALAPALSQAAPVMQIKADCEQTETRSGKTKSVQYAATLELETRGDGVLVVKVQGPESRFTGANMIATVKNVDVQRTANGAQAMGTSLETVRLSDRVTKYDKFTSVRLNRSQARLVSMFEYDDTGRWPKRSFKMVVECTPTVALGSEDISALVDAVNVNAPGL